MNIDQKIEQYLNSLHYSLSSMSISEKAEVITKIKYHINECLDSGQDIDYILTSLGDPNKVASRYLKEKGIPAAKKTSPGIISAILKWFCIIVITLFLLLIIVVSIILWTIFKKESSSVNLSITAKDGITSSVNGSKITINEDGIVASDTDYNKNIDELNIDTTSLTNIISINENGIEISQNEISNHNKVNKKSINAQVGKKVIRNKSLQSFDSYGDLDLYNSSIDGTLRVFGTLNANGIDASTISIFGEAHIEDSNIKEKFNVNGKLILKSSTVQGQMQVFGEIESRSADIGEEIIINGKKSKFIHSKTKNITIRENKNEPVQKIILRKESIVDGNIIFESGSGIVELDNTVVIKGQIKGATINNIKR